MSEPIHVFNACFQKRIKQTYFDKIEALSENVDLLGCLRPQSIDQNLQWSLQLALLPIFQVMTKFLMWN